MAVPPERHVDARVVRTRNEVLRTALAVLIEDGWEAVTHSRLAKIAG
jgi:DNA-binding transcriptional regulator YbjK